MALVLLAAFMLASIGGRYTWPLVPALICAAALFLMSGARVGGNPVTRSLDLVFVAALALIGFQLLPLPDGIVQALSPSTAALQDRYALTPPGAWHPLSIHPAATRAGFGLALMAALVFWTSREAFSRGGSRAATRLLAWIGFACALVSLAQRATAPRTVLWKWTVSDPRAVPFGPFIDRNHLAAWLVLVISLVAGYLVIHVRGHMSDRLRRGPRAVLMALSDGTALGVLGCMAAMLLTLAATLSRSGFIALIVASVVGTSFARRNHAKGLWVGAAAAAALLAVAAWLNLQGLADRFMSTLAPRDPDVAGRLTIWHDTIGIIRAFPLFGTGEGTFADAMFVYQQTARDILFNHAHNEYLHLTAEGGMAMLAIVATGVVLFGRAARLRLAHDDGPHRFLRIGACAGLAGIGVQSIWEVGLRAPANLVLAAILAGIVVGEHGDSSSEIAAA